MLNKLNCLENLKKTVLVVDDEYINRVMLGQILDEEFNVLYAENGQEALELIKINENVLSAVLLDLLMPVMDGGRLLDILRNDEKYHSIPVIVLTSEKDAEVESLRHGAADFITKPYDAPEVILARVTRIIELSEDRVMIQSTERDELTGLFSKSFFYEYAQLMDRYHDKRSMDSVVINVDGFRLVNEIYGKATGDEVLKKLGKISGDFAHANGGIAARGRADYFYLYIDHQESYDGFANLLKEGLTGLASESIKVRVGVYSNSKNEPEMEKRFEKARQACNTIKGSFQHKVAYYDQKMQDEAIFSQRLIYDIHDGIKEKQFEVYFQPKYAIQGDKPELKMAEALIRWRHPEFGMVSPFAFISLFEENGLISNVDHYVWEETARCIHRWKEKYGVTIPVSVNVSRIDIYDEDIVDRIEELVKRNGLTPEELHLEITESAYADNVDQIIKVADTFRAKGMSIELDDFGAGYSSLNMLANLPIDVLKMDMKFMKGVTEDEKSRRMVQIILEIADFLRVPVVAEGVETEEQYKLLKEMGCQYIQGYYFSKPLPAEEFEKLIIKELT
ncbi:MAG: EAL domain-containing protein [Lachnospiraceae bacterium]|nr:EAL domain-containing protein [Lachnospiraceae bacterium]